MRGSPLLEQIRRLEIPYPLCGNGLDLPPPVGILFLKFYKNQMLSAFPATGNRPSGSGVTAGRAASARAPEDQ